MNVRYEMQLTPLFNEQGEVVLLYLKDKFDELLMYQDDINEHLPCETNIKIELLSFFNEDERITQLRKAYQSLKAKDECRRCDQVYVEEEEPIKWSIPQYIDSFLGLETVIEDITSQGTLHIYRDGRFFWWITQPEWLKRLAENQYHVMVNIMIEVVKEDEGK